MKKKKIREIDKPQKIKGTTNELEVMARLKSSVEWDIYKRFAVRYIKQLKNVSFKLREDDPKFIVRHTELTGQALGIKMMIKMVEESGKKLEEMEK